MKKLTKILLAAGGAALIGSASVMTYLKAQTQQPEMSDLTLQNLEAMGTLKIDEFPIVQGPSHPEKHICPRCKTHHVICQGKLDGGDCINIHCLL